MQKNLSCSYCFYVVAVSIINIITATNVISNSSDYHLLLLLISLKTPSSLLGRSRKAKRYNFRPSSAKVTQFQGPAISGLLGGVLSNL